MLPAASYVLRPACFVVQGINADQFPPRVGLEELLNRPEAAYFVFILPRGLLSTAKWYP